VFDSLLKSGPTGGTYSALPRRFARRRSATPGPAQIRLNHAARPLAKVFAYVGARQKLPKTAGVPLPCRSRADKNFPLFSALKLVSWDVVWNNMNN
jgi:hypothetical protein